MIVVITRFEIKICFNIKILEQNLRNTVIFYCRCAFSVNIYKILFLPQTYNAPPPPSLKTDDNFEIFYPSLKIIGRRVY